LPVIFGSRRMSAMYYAVRLAPGLIGGSVKLPENVRRALRRAVVRPIVQPSLAVPSVAVRDAGPLKLC
jgi:hypothetical protein